MPEGTSPSSIDHKFPTGLKHSWWCGRCGENVTSDPRGQEMERILQLRWIKEEKKHALL